MFRRALPWVGGSLLVGLALIALWGWFIYSQHLQLDKQNQRELAHAARDLGTILSGLTSAADAFFNRNRFPDGMEKEALLGFSDRNPYIRPETSDPKPTLEPCGAKGAGLINPRRLALPSWFTAQNAAAEPERTFELRVNPEAIFEDVALSDAIGYLFIAGPDGKLMFALDHGATGQRRVELGELERRAQGDSEREHLTIRIENLSALETLDGEKLDSAAMALAGGSRSVRLAEEVYRLYSYPFEITEFREDADGECFVGRATWIVGGLVDPGRMSREAVTISPQWTFLLFLFLVVAVAGQPFVKLFLLSPTERFRFSDACLLLPSASFLLLLATIMMLDAGTYRRLTSLAAGGLETLAQQVENGLTAELRQMRDELVAYDERLDPRTACAVEEKDDLVNLLSRGRATSLLDAPQGYDDLSQVSWIDSSGLQFLKATVFSVNTPRVNVAHRPYFTEARDGHLWSFPDDNEARKRPFFVQSIRSFTTGGLETALSVKSGLQCSWRDQPIVTFMSSQPVSVDQPPLPLGYGFAVITADGLVLYHSDQRRILKEQLDEEMSDPERLRAAMQAETSEHFMTTYSRRPTEMFIRPFSSIEGARWFMVTFRNRQWLSTMNTEVLLRALFWLLIPFGLSLLLCLGLLVAGKRCLRLLAPDEEKADLYRALARTNAAALLLGLAGAAVLQGGWLLVWSLSFPLLMAALVAATWTSWGQLSLPPSFPRRRGPLKVAADWAWKWMRPKTQASFGPYTAWYVAAVAGIWACAAIVPGAGLFRYSWRLETDKLQLLEEKQARQHQRDWTTRDEKLQQNKRIADREAFLKDRQRHFGSYQVALAETGSSSWDRWLERNLPLYNDVAQQLRYQGSSGSRGQLGSIVKGYKNAGVGLGWTAFFGGAAIVLIAWWWLRYKVRHLFWSHLYGRQAAKDPVELARKHPFVILLIPLQQEKRVVAARTAAAMAAAVGAAVARTSGSGPREPLVVDDFDGAFFEPHRRIELLERLEDAVGQDGRAIIVSPLDPFQLLSQAGRHGDLPDDQAVPAPEKERWFRVLEQFRLHVVTVGRTAIPDPAAQDPPSAFAKMRIHEGHFRSLWRYCSQHERLTLIQVAEEGFANPLQVGALKRLVEKGLIVLRPNIMLMDPAFEEFVLQMAASPEVKTWEQPEGSLGWRGSRWILAAALLGGVVILASTQESWIRSATGLLTVVAGGMEAVWQLLRAVQRSRAPTG